MELRSGFPITSHWQATIQELAHSETLCSTICKNTNWSLDTCNKVDWSALGNGMHRLSRLQWFTYCKLLHGILNTNVQNKKFYNQSDLCPCCHNASETFLHVLTCPNKEVTRHRKHQQVILWKTLLAIHTPPQTLASIRNGILMCSTAPTPCNDTLSATSVTTTSMRIGNPHLSTIQEAFQQQSGELGWGNFLCGRISSRWRVAAYDEGLVLNQRLAQCCWAANLVKAVLNYSHSLWTFRCEVLHGHYQSETVASVLRMYNVESQVSSLSADAPQRESLSLLFPLILLYDAVRST